MKDLSQLKSHKIEIIFTDIDGTLSEEGQLKGPAYQSLWDLKRAGFKIVPVTGRPAGWCEMIARFWPVDAVIGENGAFYFRYKNQKMRRFYEQDESERASNRARLEKVKEEIFKKVPNSALASDQFCRLFDLAIDFCEDIPALPAEEIQKIKKIFEAHGATAKISSIHVNGWFGDFDKGSCCKKFAQKELGWSEETLKQKSTFIGDSPNDEPLFKLFPLSFGVANVKEFANQMQSHPSYVAPSKEGSGFFEIAQRLIETRSTDS